MLACNDGVDNDGDGLTDFPSDPGCLALASENEAPECQDGIDNDGDGETDFDGSPPDTFCAAHWQVRESAKTSCGLGAELILLLAPLFSRRRLSRSSA